MSKVESTKTLIPARARGFGQAGHHADQGEVQRAGHGQGPPARLDPGAGRGQIVPGTPGTRSLPRVEVDENREPSSGGAGHGAVRAPAGTRTGSPAGVGVPRPQALGGGSGDRAVAAGHPTGRSQRGNQRSRSASTVRSSATRLLSFSSCSVSRFSWPCGHERVEGAPLEQVDQVGGGGEQSARAGGRLHQGGRLGVDARRPPVPRVPRQPSGPGDVGRSASPNTEHSSWGPHPASDSDELTRWIRVTSCSMSVSSTTSHW